MNNTSSPHISLKEKFDGLGFSMEMLIREVGLRNKNHHLSLKALKSFLSLNGIESEVEGRVIQTDIITEDGALLKSSSDAHYVLNVDGNKMSLFFGVENCSWLSVVDEVNRRHALENKQEDFLISIRACRSYLSTLMLIKSPILPKGPDHEVVKLTDMLCEYAKDLRKGPNHNITFQRHPICSPISNYQNGIPENHVQNLIPLMNEKQRQFFDELKAGRSRSDLLMSADSFFIAFSVLLNGSIKEPLMKKIEVRSKNKDVLIEGREYVLNTPCIYPGEVVVEAMEENAWVERGKYLLDQPDGVTENVTEDFIEASCLLCENDITKKYSNFLNDPVWGWSKITSLCSELSLEMTTQNPETNLKKGMRL